jgi:hypothetical protein
VRSLLLLILVSCAPQPELWTCHAVATCDDQPADVDDYRICASDSVARTETDDWVGICTDAVALADCRHWSCSDTCTPTWTSCEVDGGFR